jgi:hypothetical protein
MECVTVFLLCDFGAGGSWQACTHPTEGCLDAYKNAMKCDGMQDLNDEIDGNDEAV